MGSQAYETLDCRIVRKAKTKSAVTQRMKKLNQALVIAAFACLACLGPNKLAAQETNNNNNNNNDRGGRRFGRGFDPQQIMSDLKDRLEVKDDKEWNALEPLIQKVMDVRREMFTSTFRGMMGGRAPRPGGDDNSNSGDRNRSRFGNPSAESESLQKAVDDKVPTADLKAALAKYVEARKAKQAELEKAQANLREHLTTRQEAIATLSGLL